MMAGSSSSSASVAVEKATSDLLMGPDWTMNIEICDSINSNHWQPKDVVKAVKKRLQHRSSKVQILALTLLETMVKNCGEYVHFQITDRHILEEMIKIVRKKADMQVRDKILALLDSWQEAFGGAGGKYPQYYWAYDELKRSGVSFPKRSPDAAPIFTPPPTHPSLRQIGYGMPSSSSKTLDETMATEIESLSMSSLESMRHVLDLLSDMLQAVNPNDRAAVKDEVIVDLVDRCRSNQKKLMQMLTTTGDEELLGRGLELNDNIQSLLARHDAIASGSSFQIQGASSSTMSSEVQSSFNQNEVKSSSPAESVSTPKASPPAAVYSEPKGENDEEEEDEFAQLARRHSKTQSVTSKDATIGSTENSGSMNTSSTTTYVSEPSTAVPSASNALALPDPPAPISTTSKDQDIIDLLSITLSLTPSSPPTTTYAPSSASSQGGMHHQIPTPSSTEGYSYAPQAYPGNSPYNSYVAPWAQPQSKSEFQTQQPQQHMYQPQLTTPPSPQQHMYQPQPTTPPSPQQLHAHYESEQALHHQQAQSEPLQSQNQHLPYSPRQQVHPHNEQYQPQPHLQSQPQHHPHLQPQPQPQLQTQSQNPRQHQPQPQPQQPMQLQSQQYQQQPQLQNQHVQYPARYPPPPWAATPGYANYQSHSQNAISTSQGNTATASYPPALGVRPSQHNQSFSSPGVDPRVGNAGQRPFVPSYKLFEDLNVFGNTDGRVSGTSSNVSGAMGPGMVGGGRK